MAQSEHQPLVSVIIPAYNAARYLEETVRSALGQTYRTIEIIIVDDGSKDATAEIGKKLAAEDSRVRYIYQENKGQSAARNTALAAAQGKYTAFLDADDLFLPTKIEEQVKFLESHPECGLCYSKILHFISDHPETLYYFDVPHPSGFLFKDLLHSNFINPLSVMVRSDILKTYGGFESSFRRVDEQYLWLKLSYHKVQFCYLDKVLGHYRIHPGSLSNEAAYFKETEERFLDLLHVIESWMSPEEKQQYDLDALIRRAKRRLMIGRWMTGKNVFAKFLLFLYYKKRNRRLLKTRV